MPFGLKMSQDVFQMRMDHITDRLPGVIAIHDDICVFGKTQEQHDRHLLQLLKAAKAKGLVFNSRKCHISQKQITFFGMIFSGQGMKPDPMKIQALQDLTMPQNQKQLQSFLGLVNYLQPFLPDIAAKTTFLREQVSKWDWTPSTDSAFQQLKQWICKTLLKTTLTYYDRTQPLTLHTDASEYGLGAALLQNGKPIAFASKTLTDVETRYANIERECLSVVFGLEKFHTYIYGRQITVYNDHKPLEMITRKPIQAAPPRLQRMLLRLQRYDYTLLYKPGKEMILADRLSRFPLRRENAPIELHQNIQHLTFTPDKINIIRGAVERDPILNTVYCITLNGWPSKISKVPRITRQFWGARDELTIEDGVLLKGNHVCIPPELYNRSLHELHETHLGIEKMQHRARATMYWPGMDADIIEYVKCCKTCTQNKATQHIQPMIPRDVPDTPWQDLAADFFTYKTNDYLLVADTFSKYPFTYKMHKKTAETILHKLTQLFSQYGTPNTISTDNGPPFNSEHFTKFMIEQRVDHITPSPHYPKSNGFIERQVKTMKTALATATASKKTLDDVLLSLRSTPIGPNLPSPREILHNHTEKRPGQPPQTIDYEEVRNYLLDRKSSQKRYHDQSHNVKPLPELKPGQKILFLSPKDENQYIEGTVTSKASTPRSYYLESQGKQYCRTRQHIHAIDTNTSQDHQREQQQLVSQDHQHTTKNHTLQDHQPRDRVLQDHQNTTKNHTLQDHQPRDRALQDHQLRHKHRTIPPNRSTPTTEIQSSTVDQLLQYLIAVNGHGNSQTTNTRPETPSSLRSESTLTTSPYQSEEDSSSSDDESIASTMSDRQLRPRAPISYNKTVLRKLHGQPQVRTCNNLSIPLPTDSSEEDTDSESKETDEEATMYSK